MDHPGSENPSVSSGSHPEDFEVEQPRVPDGEELIRLLILNLEYIFSRDYLSSDPFLVSQLDSDCNLPVRIIEEHPLIKNLTNDRNIISKALSSSENISYDQSRQSAKPAFKPVLRNTLILREVPKGTTEEAVRAILTPTLLTDVSEMKPEFGDTFFIKFKTEESALAAFGHIRTQTLNGQPVQARIKSENLLRSVSYLDPQYQQQQGFAQNGTWNKQYSGYEGDNSYNRGRGRFNRRGKKDTNQPTDDRKGRGRFPKRGGSPHMNQNSGKTIRPNQSASLAQWWPPLPSGEGPESVGYTGDFKKYSKEQLHTIITGITPETNKSVWENANSDCVRPEGEALSASEFTKPHPKDAKVEWVETRRKSNATKPVPAQQTKKPTQETKWASLLQNNGK